ncbi:hypothetical protein PSHT_11469, partial [Puccinia striiformis]
SSRSLQKKLLHHQHAKGISTEILSNVAVMAMLVEFPCFLNLLQLLQPNPIFYNNSHNPQRELPIQLAIAICCLGSNGNGSAVYRLRNLFQ